MNENPADDEKNAANEGDSSSAFGADNSSQAGEATAVPGSLSPQESASSRPPAPVSFPPRPSRSGPSRSGPPRARTSRPPPAASAPPPADQVALKSSSAPALASEHVHVTPHAASTSVGEPIVARRVIKLEESGRREITAPPPKRSSGSTPAIETSEASFDDLEVELDDDELHGLNVIPKAPALPTIDAPAAQEHQQLEQPAAWGGTARGDATPPAPVLSEPVEPSFNEAETALESNARVEETAFDSGHATADSLTTKPGSSAAEAAWQNSAPTDAAPSDAVPSGAASPGLLPDDAALHSFKEATASNEPAAAEPPLASAPRNSNPAALAEAYTSADFEEDIHLETDEPPEVEFEADASPASEPGEPMDEIEALEDLNALSTQPSGFRAPLMPDIPAAERKPPPPRRSAKPSLPRVTEPRKKPWWETLFGDDFSRAYRPMTERQLKREVDFITDQLALPKGSVILDLGCGQGEICVELARRGYSVVGYDLSVYQLAMAGDHAQAAKQKINFLQGDMREMAFEQMFDAVLCWDTSFGYFEEEKNIDVLQRIRSSLKPGGRFLLDVMNRDFAAREAPYNHWFEGDGCVCMDDMVMDWITNRLKVKRSIILDDGRSKELQYSVRLYGLSDVGRMLHDVGFRVASVSGDVATKGAFFGPHSRRIIIQSTSP